MVAEQNSFGILPILYGMSLSNESVVGGTSVNATVTLLSAAPAGGTTVRLVSSDPNIVRPPRHRLHSRRRNRCRFYNSDERSCSCHARHYRNRHRRRWLSRTANLVDSNSSWKPPATTEPFLVNAQQFHGSIGQNGDRNAPAHFASSRWRRGRQIARQHGRPGDRASKRHDSRG